MNLFIVTYIDNYGLHEHARVWADNKTEARRIFRDSLGAGYKIVDIEERES